MGLWRGLGLAIVAWLAASASARAEEPPLRRDLWHVVIHLNADLTFTETIEQEYTLLTAAGIPLADRDYVPFYPKSQSLALLDARVIEPDGEEVVAPEEARFTRPTPAAQDTPGFTGGETTTVLFPRLQPGSRTHAKWRLTQREPQAHGFNLLVRPLLEWPTGTMLIEIDAPESVLLRWGARRDGANGFSVVERVEDGRRHIVAAIANVAAEDPERDAVAPSDYQPLFAVSSLPDYAALGAIYHRQSAAQAAVTPEIAALAARIVGERTGLDAARAIHDWIANNIRYVAVYLNPNDGWVPHPAGTVLAQGYGDCKDHVALLQALLAARGIRAEAALVDWGDRYVLPPAPVPHAFNHAIAYLPDFGLFANPTDPFARLGALDRRLSDKDVVLATEQGAMAHTPPQRPEDNRYRLESWLALDAAGTVTGHGTFDAGASIETGVREDVAGARSPAELVERMLGATPEGGWGDLQTTDPKDLARPFSAHAQWVSPHGVTIQGMEAYFATPVGVDFEQPSALMRPYLSARTPRRRAVLAAAMRLEWRYHIALPTGFALARWPADMRVETAAGRYEAQYGRDAGGITVSRTLTVTRDVFPAEDFAALQTLFYAALDDTRGIFALSRMAAGGAAPAPVP
jgi:hypothetical protein